MTLKSVLVSPLRPGSALVTSRHPPLSQFDLSVREELDFEETGLLVSEGERTGTVTWVLFLGTSPS